MARSKVVYYGTTLMDITDTTAVASDVAVGKYFYTADGVKTEGTSAGGSTIIVTETEDSHGGTIVEITGDEIRLQSKTATPTTSTQSITPDTNYHGLSSVTVNPIPSEYIVPSGTKTITQNGTEDVSQYANVTVNVSSSEPTLQTKTITPTKSTQTVTPESGYDGLSSVTVNPIPNEYIIPNLRTESVTPTESSQTITPGTGYDGLSEVTVGAISSTYVGSEIDRRTSSDLTASGATVTVPSGYYSSQASKSVATATQATPSISVNSSGLITATSTQSAGYVSSGTKSATEQLTTQAAKTVTPTKSSQQAVASGVYTTGAVTVAAIPSEYITTTDATATAADINSGETAYVNGVKVTGTQVIQTYYTGTTDPSSSTGSDGDIYLKVVS